MNVTMNIKFKVNFKFSNYFFLIKIVRIFIFLNIR